MSNNKHTPTPWEVDQLAVSSVNEPLDGGDIICEAPTGYDHSMIRWDANASRIVQCVNACEGMDDPESTISVLKNSQREYLLTRSLLIDTELSNDRDRNELCNEIESLRADKAELIEALRSIIAQWDTPNWKLTESTGTIINQARQTLAKYETK
jgi:hypothetical protein